jgi:hypothetical protein
MLVAGCWTIDVLNREGAKDAKKYIFIESKTPDSIKNIGPSGKNRVF